MVCIILMLCPNFSFPRFTVFDLSLKQTISMLIYQNGRVTSKVLRAREVPINCGLNENAKLADLYFPA